MFVEQTDHTYRNITALKHGIYRDCLFIQCDFSGQTFANYEFVDCEFKECNLSNLKTDNASFKTVLFSGCKLIGIDFSGINSFLLKLKWCGLCKNRGFQNLGCCLSLIQYLFWKLYRY